MAWKVKKEMPMGSAMWGMGKVQPEAQLRTLVSRKVRYLNTPSRLRLNTTISATTPLAARLFSRTRIHPQAEQPVDHDGGHHHEHELRLAPGVENQAGQRQKQVASAAVLSQQKIARQHRGQKEQKDFAGKYHLYATLLAAAAILPADFGFTYLPL